MCESSGLPTIVALKPDLNIGGYWRMNLDQIVDLFVEKNQRTNLNSEFMFLNYQSVKCSRSEFSQSKCGEPTAVCCFGIS